MKRNKNCFCLLAISCLMLAISTTSCNKMPLTDGKIINEIRSLADFNKIHISDNIDINLIRADSCYIEITAGENLMPNIISEVVDDILIIRNDNMGNIFRNNETILSADIYFKSDIHEIYYHSIGDLHSDDYINSDSLSVFNFELNDGSGNIDFKVRCKRFDFNSYGGTSLVNIEGCCDSIDIYKKGLGPIHLEDMPVKVADVILFKGNDIYINCCNSLNARIYDFGNIYYKGQPKIKSYISPDALGKVLPY